MNPQDSNGEPTHVTDSLGNDVAVPTTDSGAAELFRDAVAKTNQATDAHNEAGQLADQIQLDHSEHKKEDYDHLNQLRINQDKIAYGASVTAKTDEQALGIYSMEHPQITQVSSNPATPAPTSQPPAPTPTQSPPVVVGSGTETPTALPGGVAPPTPTPAPVAHGGPGVLPTTPTTNPDGGVPIPVTSGTETPTTHSGGVAPPTPTTNPDGGGTLTSNAAVSTSFSTASSDQVGASNTSGSSSFSPTTSDQAATTVVKQGDTLSGIAASQGMDLNKLISLNPQISNPNLIFPGQSINLGSATPSTASTNIPTGSSYQVVTDNATPSTSSDQAAQPQKSSITTKFKNMFSSGSSSAAVSADPAKQAMVVDSHTNTDPLRIHTDNHNHPNA